MRRAKGEVVVGRLLVFVWLVCLALWMTRHHFEAVDYQAAATKASLHADVLRGEAPDPYQYKLEIISRGLESLRRTTGLPLEAIWFANTLVSILALLFAHHAWLRTYVGRREALVGAFVLAALANITFRGYQHHPYEFWGLALTCLLLRGVQREWPLWKMAGIGLVTGCVWEKHALVPAAEGLWRLARGKPFWPTLLRGMVFLAACLAVPIGLRLLLDAGLEQPRAEVDGDTTLDRQLWELVTWHHVPFVLPFWLTLLVSWRKQPGWVRMLWIALPLLALAYISQQFLLYETRSFLFLVPVFTATVAIALAPSARASGVVTSPGTGRT